MERYTTKQVAEYLGRVCPELEDEVLDVIRAAKVTGKRALKYKIDDWSKVGLAYGDILDIVDAIKAFGSSVPPMGKENSPPHTFRKSSSDFDSRGSPSDVTPCQSLADKPGSSGQSLFSTPPTRKGSRLPLDSPDSDEEPIKDNGQFECLRQYFSAEDFIALSPSVKQSYLAAKENYEHGLERKISVNLPPFMVPNMPSKKGTKDKITASVSTRQSPRVQNQPKSVVCTTQIVQPSNTESISESSTIVTEPSSKTQDSPNMSVSSNDEDKTGNDNSKSDSLDGTGNTENSSHVDSNAPSKKRRRKRQRPIDTLSHEEVAKKLPKYDVEAILSSKGEKEKAIVDKLKSDGIVYQAERKLMMRTLTKHLYFDEKGVKKYVSTDEKSGMAASVVAAYPKFADNSDPNKRPWFRVFDPAGPSGYIANCIVGIQRAMNPSDRLRGGGQGKLVDVDDVDADATASTSTSTDNYHDPDAEWMSLTMPFQVSKAQLIQGMKKSFPIRRRWILEKCPSITEVLERYVHLVSFDSEMVEMEFNLIHPDKSSLFLQNFPPLVNAVLRINGRDQMKVKHIEKGENKDTIEACLFLADKLPRPNLKRFANKSSDNSVLPKQKTLLACVPRGVNVQDFINERRERAKGPVQPYLLALVPEGQVTMLSIIVDSKTIALHTTSIMKGLDILFKVYYVFHVHYTLGWKMFWEMVQNGIYKIEPRKLTNSAREILMRYKLN